MGKLRINCHEKYQKNYNDKFEQTEKLLLISIQGFKPFLFDNYKTLLTKDLKVRKFFGCSPKP